MPATAPPTQYEDFEYKLKRAKYGPLKPGAMVVTKKGVYGRVEEIKRGCWFPWENEVDLEVEDGNYGWCQVKDLEEWCQP